MDKNTVKELTKLCRIQCTEADEENFFKDLSGILKYFDQLDEINTDGVKPLDHVLESIINVTREDEVLPSLPRPLFLSNAPEQSGGMIRVPLVMKETR